MLTEKEAGQSFKNRDGSHGWELGNKRRVTVTTFKSKVYVDIREHYEKDGKVLLQSGLGELC